MNNTDTLLNRCLEAITKSFDRYSLKTFEDLPKNIHRKLFQILSRSSLDVYGFKFVDEETKVLDLRDCPDLSDDGICKLIRCKYVWKVDLTQISGQRTAITLKGIQALTQYCPYIRVLLLPKCINIDDTCVLEIAKAFGDRLVQLSLSNCPLITDESLKHLGKYCKSLRAIDLNATKITDMGVFELMSKNVSATIEELHIGNCKDLTDESIEAILMKSKRIKFLLFHGCPKLTNASRIALDGYMNNSENAKIKHLTWTVSL